MFTSLLVFLVLKPNDRAVQVKVSLARALIMNPHLCLGRFKMEARAIKNERVESKFAFER